MTTNYYEDLLPYLTRASFSIYVLYNFGIIYGSLLLYALEKIVNQILWITMRCEQVPFGQDYKLTMEGRI